MNQFKHVVAKRCSNPDHIVWEVVWRDGERDTIHSGLWPRHISDESRAALDEARSWLFIREARASATLVPKGSQGAAPD